MSEQRLIDANALNKRFEGLKEGATLLDAVFLDGAMSVVDTAPTIATETLPIVKELRAEIERLQTVSDNWEKQWNGEYQMRKTMEEKLARYEKAEQEGRLAEFPCKVKDTVWVNGRFGLLEATVTRIYQDCSGIWRIHVEPCGIAPIWLVYEMTLDNFGKTVFLTREEAEAALRERKKTDGLSKSVDH